ncbi:bifunctional nuclease family protein [Desulfurobacterium sp.]
MVEVSVIGVTHDRLSGLPIIILGNVEENFAIPIWIGEYEAELLETHLLGAVAPRPFPYDLMCDIIQVLGGEVERVVINDFDNGIYFATIVVRRYDGELINVDARPSDSINVAVRLGAPIYVTRDVIQRASIVSLNGNPNYTREQKAEFEELLKYLFEEGEEE